MATKQVFEQVLSRFPKMQMQLAFAYGSGVFQQQGHKDMSKNMLDFVFVVDEPEEWHRQNMTQNYKHYSFLKYLGPKVIHQVQDRSGARVYYNTLVRCEGRLIKYGVIDTKALIADLLDWETLYISGRLHKPVQMLLQKPNQALSAALSENLNSAVHAALLMLDDTFTEEELYCKIAGLSYTGDFRMSVGEDKNKIMNIVKPNMDRFRQQYEPILNNEEHLYWHKNEGCFEQGLGAVSTLHHLNLLPKMVQFALVAHRNMDGRARDTEDVLKSLAHDSECGEIIQDCVSDIVKQSSLSQSVKGVFTAGFRKTVKYSWSKLSKMWKSIRK